MQNIHCVCTFVVVSVGLLGASLQLQADPWYQQGQASWYGKQFAGRKTASGEIFSPQEMTAAHRQLPLGTKVIVENPSTGDVTEVKITDRGPYADPKRRIIDLSRAAADSIGLVEQGVGRVRVAVSESGVDPRKTNKESLDYEVQVGTFVEQEHAQEVLNQMQPRFPTAYVEPRQGPSGTFYRLRIGPFDTEERAALVAKALKREGHKIFLDEVPE